MQKKRRRGVWYTNREGSGWLVSVLLLLLSRGAVTMGRWLQCLDPELGLGFPCGTPPELALAGLGPLAPLCCFHPPPTSSYRKWGGKHDRSERSNRGVFGWVVPTQPSTLLPPLLLRTHLCPSVWPYPNDGEQVPTLSLWGAHQMPPNQCSPCPQHPKQIILTSRTPGTGTVFSFGACVAHGTMGE